jgi:hypothetical protein
LERNDTFLGGSTCLHLNRLADNILKKGQQHLEVVVEYNLKG